MREDGTPPGSIGRGYPGVSVYHAETVTKCAPAVFDEHGALANVDEAVGELVNTYGVGGFTGYYNDQGATEERMRHGMYWSGDLAYRDAEGWIYKTLKRTLIAEGGGGRCVVGAGGAGAQLCRRERMMLVGHV
jgi:fatty-acyl-CoA synthase